MIKNLLLILALFVVGCSETETALKCELYKICQGESCSTNVQKHIEQVIFSKNKIIDGTHDASSYALFNDGNIVFGAPTREYMESVIKQEEYISFKPYWVKPLGVKTLYTEALILVEEFEYTEEMKMTISPFAKYTTAANHYICKKQN